MKKYPNQPKIPLEKDFTRQALSRRNKFVSEVTGVDLNALKSGVGIDCYKGNVENIFGFIQIPVGLAGPLILKGQHAKGDFFIPLATTEGTLVASYNRGMKAINQCGGARVEVVKNEIYSSVTFLTDNAESARSLQDWINNNQPNIQKTVEATTKHGKYIRSECTLYGTRLLVNFVYDPANAMGINMITSASFSVSAMISQQNNNIDFFLPSAFQGDKKATYYSFHRGRGRSVMAEVVISDEVLKKTLKSSAESIYCYYRNNIETAHLVGGYGFNMHIANGITALALATGQDPAYVGESANGHLIVEGQGDGLLFSVQIPSLYIGTVGGGTGLPTYKPCLEMLGCTGKDSALKLAEIFAGTCLAGEISVLSAIACHNFVEAHDTLGRNRPA
jgi:hydroxymethylglutaryl-CoA reductase (NADPH)